MKAAAQLQPNIIPLAQPTPHKATNGAKQSRFRILAYVNPRTESKSWRVGGIKRDGGRVRENFKDLQAAQCRQIELESEWLVRHTETAVRATKLTDTQLRLAELAFIKLDADADLPLAVDYWLKHGKQHAVAESPRIDEAVEQFKAWLETTDELRGRTKANLRLRAGIFANSVPNMRVADITPDTVFGYLENREIGKTSKDNDRRALSRFFGWCIDRPRRWIKLNPARKEKRERRGTNGATPSILSLADCKALLKAAEAHRGGRLVPYVAVCLFGGLRPLEAARLTWQQVNLNDDEIRLEGQQTKTGSPRIVAVCPTLRCWLKTKKYHKRAFYPSNWRRDFDSIKEAAGFCGRPTKEKPNLKPWPEDVLRHTAISHYFRQTGSYGQAAEQFGNSEAIIKKYYQGRVSSKDTKKFYGLRPKKKLAAS